MDSRPEDADEIDARLRSAFLPADGVISKVIEHAMRPDRRRSTRVPLAVVAAAAVMIAIVAVIVFRPNSAEARPFVRLTGVGSVAVASSPDGEVWVTNRIESLPKGGSLIVIRPVGGE